MLSYQHYLNIFEDTYLTLSGVCCLVVKGSFLVIFTFILQGVRDSSVAEPLLGSLLTKRMWAPNQH